MRSKKGGPPKRTRTAQRGGGKSRGSGRRAVSKRAGRRSKANVRVSRWRRLALGAGFVGVAVVVGVGTVMLERAGSQVDTLLARPLWAEQGQITAGVQVSPGLGIGPDTLAEVLQRAGYSRVSVPERPGDFTVDTQRIFARDGDVDVLVTFEDQRVASVSPERVHRFQATELAGTGVSGERRKPVSLSELPEHVPLALLAMEDARFFQHPGVDAWGILRAVIVNIIGDGYQQGGSTLTQQLAKNLFLTPERSLERKVKELSLAVALEQRLSKEEILELYLNQVYLGSVSGVGISGVQQAAQVYFGTSARRLTLAQAATLAGIISAPNRYSPLRHPQRASERRDLVLGRMEELGWLSSNDRVAASRASLGIQRFRGHRSAPWALDAAVAQVEEALGEGTVSDGALSIQTTIDALLQQVAERAVADGLRDLEDAFQGARGAQAALVALDPSDGSVLAMVGGREYSAGAFNRAVNGKRQIGSTVKPLSWLALISSNPEVSPSTKLPDEPIERQVNGEAWAPSNYDGEFLGEVTLEEALAASRNIPAVHVSEAIGLENLTEFLGRLGLDDARPYPSMALGAFDASPLELAAAYTVFPGLGRATQPRLVKSVRLPDGTEGWERGVSKRRITTDASAFLAHTMLKTVVDSGTGRGVRKYTVDGEVGGKTGTTDGGRDAWFVGYTPDLVVAVWVGFDKSASLGLTGAQAALPIWARFVERSGRQSHVGMEAPEDVIQVPICVDSRAPAAVQCPDTTVAWFRTQEEAQPVCEIHSDKTMFSEARSIIDGIRNRLRPEQTTSASEGEVVAPKKPAKRGFWQRLRRRRGGDGQ